LDLLIFKLEEEHLLLAAGKTKWIPFATKEVEQVLERLRESELQRTIESASVAHEWGLGDDATLRELAEAAPSPAWREILDSHLEALTTQAHEISRVRDVNLQHLRAAQRATQDTLSRLDGNGVTDSFSGTRHSGAAFAALIDRRA
jgi:hypothetical protein